MDELDGLAELSKDGVHDPATMPFAVPWTDRPPMERARGVMQHHWNQLASWAADRWSLPLAVFHDGAVIGSQSVTGKEFAAVRQVSTGSWLGLRYQGHGFGTEMRAAVLELAFAGLGAQVAVTAAMTDNPASLGVSRKLGYRDNGVLRSAVRAGWGYEQQLALELEDWRAHRSVPVQIEGLEDCIDQFGLAAQT